MRDRATTAVGAWTVGTWVVAVALMATATVVAQEEQYPIFTVDHLAGTMATVGPNFAAARRALDSGDYGPAKELLVRCREQLATTITFWRDRDRDDAIGFLRSTLRKLDDLDTVLSTAPVDSDAAIQLGGEIGQACTACHDVYREQDPASGEYRLNESAL